MFRKQLFMALKIMIEQKMTFFHIVKCENVNVNNNEKSAMFSK